MTNGGNGGLGGSCRCGNNDEDDGAVMTAIVAVMVWVGVASGGDGM